MRGKLIGVSINGERIDCQPDSVLSMDQQPIHVAWVSIPHQKEVDIKAGDKLKQVEFSGQVFSGVVREVNDKEVIIYLYL